MISRTLNLALAAAGAASAILIPPSVSSAELDLGDDMAMEIVATSYPRSVSLDCATCEFASKEADDLVWTQRNGNSFLLDFEVGPREDSLTIDGTQLYPPTFGYFTQPFRVAQINPDGENLTLRVTGYTFHYNSAETVSEAGIELIPMTFQINSIEGKAVAPPALTINLLKDPNGKLMIASFQTAKPNEKSPIDEEKECKEWPLYCKWKAIMADKVNGIKSHMGRPGCHKNKGNPMAGELYEGKPPHRFRPGHPHHRPHHMAGSHGHRHHRGHRMHMMLRRVFLTVFIPILIGIFAGTLTYLVGMALGCLIAVVVAKARGQPMYESVAQEEEDSENVEDRGEKEVYTESELPQYDAPPVYEEAVEKEVVEDKQ
ncbi:uncharacterized protein CC84DRAFT_1207965 [Paraphaeosphaeria sporulosa]|uniref:DUF7728 domain-containing protein n=1 Tax=Paraphaeosphaeria sporulosa TaxID=1460663 RepID=A0A177C964_9PLEO|nr:uncharacterized protein CC84DRAFT_1207965 [Paraphaeosphaeria sporulosa]OAG03260.1 hypothetical protein CC84DRAFT_1207965 [Paraphaeosphaeria sporulosa]